MTAVRLYTMPVKTHIECIREFLLQIPDIISDLLKVANNDGTTPLSVRTGSGGTILLVACNKGDIKIVKKLLEAGADPNETDKFGITPMSVRTGSGGTILHDACDKGDIDLVKKLLEAGADPNVTDEFGFTPLMRAVVSTSKYGITTDVVHSIITALCNSKCNLNAAFVPSSPSDSNVHYCEGSTVLHVAIDRWKFDRLCVQALVDNGAALYARNVHGHTPFHIASMRGHHHLIKLLAPSPKSFHFKDNDGCTPVYYACKNSHVEFIRNLIVQIPDVVIGYLMKLANNDGTTPLSVRTDSGGTILHVACDKGDINLVKNLLEAGADPNVKDELGLTPLIRAVVNTGASDSDVSSIVTILCNNNCHVNATFQPCKSSGKYVQWKGTTALYMAVDRMECCFLCVKALIDNGATVDVTDTQGHSPLHIASIRGHFRLIKPLAPSPEFFCLKDNYGCTPLYYACKYSHLECIRTFMDQIPEVISDLMKVANNDGTTPLSVSLRTGSGRTILHIACEKGDFSIVKKVLEAGADPDSLDGSTFTPLMLAVKHVDDAKAADIVTILCEFKCNVNIQTPHFSSSLTALHLACKLGKEKCVQILVAN